MLDDATCGPFKYSNSTPCVCTRVDLVMQMHPEAVRLLIRAAQYCDATRVHMRNAETTEPNRIRNAYSIECCSYLIHNAPRALAITLCVCVCRHTPLSNSGGGTRSLPAAHTNKNNNNAAASNEQAPLCRIKSHYHTSANYITIYLHVSRMNYTNRIQ